MSQQNEIPCAGCGYTFDQGALGKYGCPNCEGDGIRTTAPKAIKPKTCKACGTSFQPSRWLMAARVCSQHCALELARTQRMKDERKADALKAEMLNKQQGVT